ncbi:MAG: arylsulfatase, partial [Planctomycetes bacterium]|nr:arylsulfatase [Planctomycetota bacterium]
MSNPPKPNVVFVITDDQGYPDLGCTGNPWIQTPSIDRFHGQSVRFSDFHVAPLCTPTRGAIMSGHRPVRNGAWATCWGRSILRRDQVTMANVFQNSGYTTGMFGKWHLGDNYPYRPQDRGFQKAVWHKGGGVGQTPDFWGNNYFDDTYFHSDKPVAHDGYCTDVWFAEAMKFIEENRERPFFCYLSTNAPHSPYLVAERYKQPYLSNPDIAEPAFYGMITNIDENFGRLRQHLQRLGLEDNTILIFMTDNGSSGSCHLDRQQFMTKGYNAGMRGKKGSYYDGGHRVPFLVRWPAGGLNGGRDIAEMSLHIDLLPTFIDLCGLKPPPGVVFDGLSLAPLLRGERAALPGDRFEFVQYRQSTEAPDKWTNAVMTRRWRLVRGQELYDIKADPG